MTITSADSIRGNFRSNGRLYLVRCPECERENVAAAVSSGQCAWCGWSEVDARGVDDGWRDDEGDAA